MKMSRRERRAYNMGKLAGYAEGYSKGLYDGNPFNAIIKAVQDATKHIAEAMNDPEIRAAIEEAKENPDFKADLLDDKLEIVGGNDDE